MEISIKNKAKVYQTWLMLKITYTLVPIVIGLDKLWTGMIVDWAQYVSPMAMDYIPLDLPQFLITLGIIEVVAGFIVWFHPKIGAYLVIALLGLIIINLFSMNGYYDIIARDAVIAIGALALAWLSDAF